MSLCWTCYWWLSIINEIRYIIMLRIRYHHVSPFWRVRLTTSNTMIKTRQRTVTTMGTPAKNSIIWCLGLAGMIENIYRNNRMENSSNATILRSLTTSCGLSKFYCRNDYIWSYPVPAFHHIDPDFIILIKTIIFKLKEWYSTNAFISLLKLLMY